MTRLLASPKSALTLLAATAVLIGTVVGTSGPSASAAPIPNPQAAANAAVVYAHDRGWNSGIAVIDTATGREITAGSATSYFPSESTVKVFIAARLLLTGQMTGSATAIAYKMITQSDDASANALYARVGGDGLLPWIAAHYKIPSLGARPVRAGHWGSTRITPLGMARFYAKVKVDPRVGPWLINAMHHATHFGSDGTYQWHGLKAADVNAAVKQGWGGDDPGFDSIGTPSTGYVNGDRYVVTIYTNHIPGTSLATAEAIVSAQARLLMPNGRIPGFYGNPLLTVEKITIAKGKITLTGWAFDPDQPTRAIEIRVLNWTTRAYQHLTTVHRHEVNVLYYAPGNHGFTATITGRPGTHIYYVQAINVGSGINVAKELIITVPAPPS